MADRLSFLMFLSDSLNNMKFAEQISKELKRHPIGLIYLDIKHFGEIERKYGHKVCDRILRALKQLIVEASKSDKGEILVYKILGDDVFLFVRMKQDEAKIMKAGLRDVSQELRIELQNKLNQLKVLPEDIELYSGTSILNQNSKRSIDNLLYHAIKEAIFEAKSEADTEYTLLRAEFREILERKNITAHYQPIVSLSTGEAYGYEALTRGPKDSYFAAPTRLFDFAEKEEQLYALESIARERAIISFAGNDPFLKLFLNMNANVILDPQFTPGQTLKLLKKFNLTPQNVVFEITERQSIDDFSTFTKVLEYYRKQGYRIAIDDAGAGYSSLQAIAELRPDYIKIDRSIISDIDRDKIKEILLDTLIDFARKINCHIIAEGIETNEELTKVIRLGAHFGQGYLLGRPGAGFAGVSDQAVELIKKHRAPDLTSSTNTMTVGDIVRPIRMFEEQTLVSEVVEYFNKLPNESGVVIVRGKKPVGLVMREKLFQSLASQYGVPLYWKRSIQKLMDGYPLVLEESVPVETASRLAMARDQQRIYDYVIATREGEISGVVSIQSILDTMTDVKIELAKESNPLTGLPGNRRVERELARRIGQNKPFSIIYADLDYFKWFNDQYGFQRGDRVIRFLAELLQAATAIANVEDEFVGHIGGDDFIMITSHPNPSELCEHIIGQFDKEIRNYYDQQLLEALDSGGGWLSVTNRQGEVVPAKGVCLSLALLECLGGDMSCLSLEVISKRAGELKKLAKERVGSVYVKGSCQLQR
ncbi:GGDEF domain-containing protein [Effusibacillus lacus]|uniref:Diguanylate phosphodiesterase n=1 Tax=Effusibacillus lacus TaxID=1348429 RepID=A0A292YK65_9BACL|nr:EAL domain-containing protein [Effusibacillus lacus]TCS69787.1 diguanylate cyclase (GGDEF)-like protein [Effusibacillus lacus]GAX88870.1 diguanylate phosphodiesterase [Effusibacillus lacus]